MNYEDKNRETEEAQVETALRSFRESVHGWSELEFGRARVVRRSRWDAIAMTVVRPAMGWAMAAVLLVASAGVPMAVHHERQVAAERRMVLERQQELEAATAKPQAAAEMNLEMNDDELMSHVDSDIAQSTPDAMEPLASMMGDGTSK